MRLLIGVAVVFTLFQWIATATGSDRGQAGLLVGAVVIAATFAAERLTFGTDLRTGGAAPGFRNPGLARRACGAGGRRAAASRHPGVPDADPYPVRDLPWVDAAVAGTVRAGRARRRGALPGLSVRPPARRPIVLERRPGGERTLRARPPFHVRDAAVADRARVGAPRRDRVIPARPPLRARGRTIWAPAIVHFVIQGAVKVTSAVEASPQFPLAWIVASATLPFAAFLIPGTGGTRLRR